MFNNKENKFFNCCVSVAYLAKSCELKTLFTIGSIFIYKIKILNPITDDFSFLSWNFGLYDCYIWWITVQLNSTYCYEDWYLKNFKVEKKIKFKVAAAIKAHSEIKWIT